MALSRKQFFFSPAPSGPRTSAGLLILRLIAGPAFILHGWPKIQNPFGWMGANTQMPGILQAFAALAEFGGGLGWFVGLMTPFCSFGILCTMVVAVSKHLLAGDPFVGKGGSYELALVYAAIAILFLLMGPGRHSVDARIAATSPARNGSKKGSSRPRAAA